MGLQLSGRAFAQCPKCKLLKRNKEKKKQGRKEGGMKGKLEAGHLEYAQPALSSAAPLFPRDGLRQNSLKGRRLGDRVISSDGWGGQRRSRILRTELESQVMM